VWVDEKSLSPVETVAPPKKSRGMGKLRGFAGNIFVLAKVKISCLLHSSAQGGNKCSCR